MITLLANIDNNIFEFLPEYNFYLFVFSNTDCDIDKQTIAGTQCNGQVLFDIVVDLPSGIYDLSIYGKTENNDETDGAILLKTEKAKIYNPDSNCYSFPYLLNENNYIISDSDGTLLEY